jgi:competence protein ComEC
MTPIYFKSELKEGTYIVKITQPPTRKPKTTFLKCAFIQDYKNNPISGYIQVMLPTDSMSENFRYGDMIAFSGAPQLLDKSKNPFEFDYAQFQHFRNIYYRIYLSEEQLKLLKRNTGNRLFSSVYALRAYFIEVLHQHIATLDERAVAGAILLGYRDDMSNDIVQAYASSGALHVMSVSGLHVGIIFLALQFLLAWMDKYPKLRIPKALLLIMGMMLYAILTGLAPSVMRAVVMFSFFVVAKAIKRDANMFNILAVSCLCLLLYNPYLITEVGFKLSYLAVLGIVVLYPIVHKQWVVKKQNPVICMVCNIRFYSCAVGYISHRTVLLPSVSSMVYYIQFDSHSY